MIKMVVFDMAGTTVDEDNVVYKTLLRAINERGPAVTLDEVLAEGAGKEKLQAIRSILLLKQVNDENLALEIFEQFQTLLEEAYSSQQIFEQSNASAVFKALRENGILVVLNTGYSREIAETLVEKLGWKLGVDLDALITATDVELNRPNPDMILLAMERLGITDAKEVAKVGDSAVDIQEGKNAGCGLSIGVTTGAHTLAQLQQADPDYIINDLSELLPILGNIDF